MPPSHDTPPPHDGRALARLLSGLSGTGAIDARRVAVVVAHADDETLAVGGQLPRLEGITIVHVTDGAPRDLRDARELGFSSAGSYAAARRAELALAMALAGVPASAMLALDLPDQGVASVMAALAGRIEMLLVERRIEVVLTHAYEGGHPDHDAVAFAVHRAARRTGTAVIEVPLYHAGPGGTVRQVFPGPAAHDSPAETVRPLTAAELGRKREMMAAFVTQRRVLEQFTETAERFRPAAPTDFTRLPNGGKLLYESYGWGVRGEHWLAAVAAAGA